jgi:hypothetical protein
LPGVAVPGVNDWMPMETAVLVRAGEVMALPKAAAGSRMSERLYNARSVRSLLTLC